MINISNVILYCPALLDGWPQEFPTYNILEIEAIRKEEYMSTSNKSFEYINPYLAGTKSD